MERRKVIKMASLSLGYALTGGALSMVVSGCKNDASAPLLQTKLKPERFKLLSTIVELIIPKSETPGAVDAGVDRFLDKAYAEYLNEAEQIEFDNSLSYFDLNAREIYGKNFNALSNDKQIMLLSKAAKESDALNLKTTHPFEVLKAYTVSAFFSSELVAMEILDYDPVPGPYQGCLPITETTGRNSAI